ncbi:MAG: molybdenum cofactor biosynthesis protein MoaE [Chloroflexota bacterium]
MIYVTPDPLNPQEITDLVRKSSNGAVVTFLGAVRDSSEGRDVLHLEYEAYQPMAQNMLQQIAEEVRERWGIEDMSIAHRVGKLEIGEISLVVALASPHRKEAFEASQHVLDRIKAVVPIWKKEVFQGGEAWVGSHEEGTTSPAP